MEKELTTELEELMNRSDINGVICCDSLGLPIAVRGVAQEKYAGAISSIASEAAKVFPSESQRPTICVESDNSTLLIQCNEKVTVGVFKEKI